MKVKAKFDNDNNKVEVKLLIKHPMSTGLQKDKNNGDLIPAKFIQELSCMHGDKLVFLANFGRAVSKDPYLAFSFSGAKAGDTLILKWFDNLGENEEKEVVIK
jgi:sulfur-oxidizing protein SoxZ